MLHFVSDVYNDFFLRSEPLFQTAELQNDTDGSIPRLTRPIGKHVWTAPSQGQARSAS